MSLSHRLLVALLILAPGVGWAGEPWMFDWGERCRVPVTERMEKKGHSATSTFVLDLQPVGSGFELEFTDFEMTALDGVDPSDPRARAVFEQLGQQAALIPVTRIDSFGRFRGVSGLDELIESVVAKRTQDDPELAARMRVALSSPQMRAQLEEKMGDYWRSWVESWVGAELAPSETREHASEVAVVGGVLPIAVKMEHRGDAPGAPGLARLLLVNTTGGPETAEMTRNMVGKLAPERAEEFRAMRIMVRKTTTIEADIEVNGLRPHRVRIVAEMEAEQDGQVHRRRDVREDTFHWDRAEGCGG